MYPASTVLDMSSALLNDKIKSLYTDAAQIPYLNIAIRELVQEMQLHNIPVTNSVSAVIPLLAGATTITLPADLIEIREIYEADSGLDNYLPLRKVTSLPKNWTASASKTYWAWENGGISTLPSTGAKDIRIDYIGTIQAPITLATDNINILNSENFLAYRTAGLCAEFIGANLQRADKCNTFAGAALDRMLGIGVKSGQSQGVKRLPFRFGLKRHG